MRRGFELDSHLRRPAWGCHSSPDMRFKNMALYRRWLVCLIVVLFGGVAGHIGVSGSSEKGGTGTVPMEERASQRSTIEKSTLPLWTSTRSQTARENAEAHWVKHHREFPEYRSAEEYIAGAHQFLRGPPEGTLFKYRENGDRLLYHPATNTFAVQAKSGAPRTMFRPRNGRQYWSRQ